MKKEFLPIGTVVLLKNATKKIMITGYLPKTKGKPDEIYDYSACLFPEGIVASNQTAVFNTEQIAEIIQPGYSNEETEKFVAALNEIVNAENVQTVQEDTAESSEGGAAPVQPEPVVEEPMEEQPQEEEPEALDMPTPVEPAPAPVEQEVEEPSIEDPGLDDTPVEPTPEETLAEPQPETPAPVVEEQAPASAPAPAPAPFDNNGPVGVDSIKPFSE